MSIQEVLTLDSAELSRWQIYFRLYGTHSEREDLRMGIIASTVYNSTLTKGPRKSPLDFIPKWGKGNTSKENLPSPEVLNKKLKAFGTLIRGMKGKKNVNPKHRKSRDTSSRRHKSIAKSPPECQEGSEGFCYNI